MEARRQLKNLDNRWDISTHLEHAEQEKIQMRKVNLYKKIVNQNEWFSHPEA